MLHADARACGAHKPELYLDERAVDRLGRPRACARLEAQASPLLDQLYCAPGNAGIAEVADCVALDVADHAAVVGFCRENDDRPGRDRPRGAARRRARRRSRSGTASRCSGRRSAAAQLEGSKGFTKDLCARVRHPDRRLCAASTTRPPPRPIWRTQSAAHRGQGRRARRRQGRRHRRDAARKREAAIDACFGGAFGAAGAEVVIEEFLTARKRASSRWSTARPRSRSPRRRTTSAPATATPAPIPAAWAPIRRRRS